MGGFDKLTMEQEFKPRVSIEKRIRAWRGVAKTRLRVKHIKWNESWIGGFRRRL
jgi:hypothetical protein